MFHELNIYEIYGVHVFGETDFNYATKITEDLYNWILNSEN